MDNYPQHLIEQYLKASSKLKKFFERISMFKRFAPNVQELSSDFNRLAHKFEEAGIYPYAAMCQLGVAKSEFAMGNNINECQAYLRAARAFLTAHQTSMSLHLRSASACYKEGALRCYQHALERTADDTVLKAAIIREMTPLQPHLNEQNTSSCFVSPAHEINELELAAHNCLENCDFLGALHNLDDIVDNINERKKHDVYENLLQRVELLRLLLLVVCNLPPARQSPSHIKLIEYFYSLSSFDEIYDPSAPAKHSLDAIIKPALQYLLAEVVLAWCELRWNDLKLLLKQLQHECTSLNSAQRFVIEAICRQIDENL